MREITVKLYKFDELSEKAKEAAVQKYGTFDQDECDFLTDYFENDLAEHYGFPDAKVNWSLSCCQGDGVSFTGTWSGEELLAILNRVYENSIPRNVKRLLPFIDQVEFKRGNLSYVHEYSVSTNIQDIYGNWKDYPERVGKVFEELEKAINDYRLKVCKELEDTGYKEIEYKESAEYFAEMAESNEWEFYESGEML